MEKDLVARHGLDQDFEHFCEVFAKAVGAESASAAKQQIRLAMPETTHTGKPSPDSNSEQSGCARNGIY